MSKKVLIKSASWSLLNQIFSRGSMMVAAIILARFLDVSAYASYSYFHITVTMLSAYAAMGVGVTATKFFAEFRHDVSDKEKVQTLAAMIVLSIGFSIAAFFIVLVIPTDLISGDLSISSRMIALGVLALSLNVLPSGAIFGLEKYRQMAMVSFFVGMMLILGAIWSAYTQNILFSMWTIIISAFVQAVAGILITGFSIGWRSIVNGFPFRFKHVSMVLSFSGPMFLVSLMSGSGSWVVGRVILNGPGGEYAFALFTIGLQWFSLGMLLPAQVSTVLVPKLVRSQVKGYVSEISHRSFVRSGLFVAVSLAVLMLIIGLIFGEYILAIYGANYNISRWFVGAYLLAAVFGSVCAILGNALLTSNKQWQWLKFIVIWFLSLCLIAISSQVFDAWSGAISYCGAYILLIIVSYIYSYRHKII